LEFAAHGQVASNWATWLFFVVDSQIKVANRPAEQELEFQVRHCRQPFLECSLFSKAAHMRPIIEHQPFTNLIRGRTPT
jgi:hypothetical protein